MPTLFSLLARRKLRQRSTRAAATNPNALGASMDEIERTLCQVFPAGSYSIVQDVYASYRIRPGEYILNVEVSGAGDRNGLYVVKLGKQDRLKKEFDGWTACWPDGARHDLVLTTLEPHHQDGKLIALVYADADQIIGVDQTLSLEQAMLDCVRLGVPTPASIADCLFMLYERLGLVLYRNAYTDDPENPSVPFAAARLDDHLDDNIAGLRAKTPTATDLRATALSAAEAAGMPEAFTQPEVFAQAVVATPAATVPRLRRGSAHGDLHGRNVLVGKIGDRVLWPAVFDYGDMGTDNVIGWDFVKLETEFKVRAYPDVFDKPVVPYGGDIVRLERDLHAETEECRNANRWPDVPAAGTPLERFRWLVLTVRRHACNHLGLYCSRSREWLAEYYFLLAIYGMNGIRFENLTDVQRLAGYLSSGAAAARYINAPPPS